MSIAVEASPPAVPETQRLYTYDELALKCRKPINPMNCGMGAYYVANAIILSPGNRVSLPSGLHDWVAAHDLGKVIGAPIDMVLSPHRAVQPDVAFIAKDRLAIIERVIMGPADLVAEIVSLQGRSRDRIEKRDLYEQHGVKEYWIIDPEPETVEVLALVNGRYELVKRSLPGETASSRLLPGFEVSVSDLLRGK